MKMARKDFAEKRVEKLESMDQVIEMIGLLEIRTNQVRAT